MPKWKPFKRVKNVTRKINIKPKKLIRNIAHNALRNIPVVSNGYNLIDTVKPLRLLKNKNDTRKAQNLITQVNEVLQAPEQAKANKAKVAELEANINQLSLPWYEKFKIWIRIKWAIARGMVTGVSITLIIAIVAIGYFWFATPSKARRW